MLVDDESSGKCTLLLSGYLRARKLSVNQLVIKPFCYLYHALCYTHGSLVNLFSQIRSMFLALGIFNSPKLKC